MPSPLLRALCLADLFLYCHSHDSTIRITIIDNRQHLSFLKSNCMYFNITINFLSRPRNSISADSFKCFTHSIIIFPSCGHLRNIAYRTEAAPSVYLYANRKTCMFIINTATHRCCRMNRLIIPTIYDSKNHGLSSPLANSKNKQKNKTNWWILSNSPLPCRIIVTWEVSRLNFAVICDVPQIVEQGIICANTPRMGRINSLSIYFQPFSNV